MNTTNTRVFCLLLIVLSIACVQAAAQSRIVIITGSGSVSAGSGGGDPGDTISIAITLSGGVDVEAFGFNVNWNSSYLSYVSASKGSLIPSTNWTFSPGTAGSSSVTIGGYGVPALGSSGTLAVVTFKIKETAPYGTTTITISDVTDGLSAGGSGTVTVYKKVKILSFTADPSTITKGESSTLSWQIENGTSASIDQGVGPVSATSGSKTVSPTSTTTYKLTAQGDYGSSDSKSVTVSISSVARPVIEYFRVDKSTVVKGENVTLSWKIDNADNASIDNGVGKVNKSAGTATDKPSKDTTYTLTATNSGGSTTASVSVSVVNEPVINWFTSSTDSNSPVNKNEQAILGWNVTGADTVSISDGIGNVDNEAGMLGVKPGKTNTYILTAINRAGSSSASATVYVTNAPRIAEFSATPSAILADQTVNLSWKAVGADTVVIHPGIGTFTGSSGTCTYKPSGSCTLTMQASNGSGTDDANLNITVLSSPPDLELTLNKLKKRTLNVIPSLEIMRRLGMGTVGIPYELEASIENIGSGNADSFIVALVENGELLETTAVKGLSAGQSVKVTFDYTPIYVGSSVLELIADYSNDVPEYSKSNNVVRGTFTGIEVKGVDLVVSNIAVVKPNIPGVKNILTISFRLSNVGNTDSGKFEYAVYITRKDKPISSKDTEVLNGTIMNLNAHESIEISKTVILKKIPKKFYIRCFSDVNAEVAEVNEENNEGKKEFSRKEL
jgi:hypothetical protein